MTTTTAQPAQEPRRTPGGYGSTTTAPQTAHDALRGQDGATTIAAPARRDTHRATARRYGAPSTTITRTPQARATAWRDADADRQLARGDALRALAWLATAAHPSTPEATFNRRYALALAAMARWDECRFALDAMRPQAVAA
jgi:hypothetical protein